MTDTVPYFDATRKMRDFDRLGFIALAAHSDGGHVRHRGRLIIRVRKICIRIIVAMYRIIVLLEAFVLRRPILGRAPIKERKLYRSAQEIST